MLRAEEQSSDNNHNLNIPIIAFTSGKGGCGKTTLAVNFANIISKSGKNVLLIDMDVSNRGTTGMFSKWTTNIHEEITCTRLIEGNLRYKDSLRKLLRVKEKDGYFLIPASSPEEPPYEEPEGVSLEELIDCLRSRIFEIAQSYDISCVIIDCFCGIDLLSTAASGISDDIIIVNEPDIITFTGSTNLFFHLTNAFDLMERKPKFHFVINRLRSTQSVVGLSRLYKENIEDAINEAILCYFPYNATIFQNFGKHPFLSDLIPRSLFVKKLKLLAYFLFKGRFDHLLFPKVSRWSNRKLRSIYKKSLDPTAIDAQHLVIKLTSFPLLIGILVLISLFIFNFFAPSPALAWTLIAIMILAAVAVFLTTLIHGSWRSGRVNFNVGLFRFRLARILHGASLLRARKFGSSLAAMFTGLLMSSIAIILLIVVIITFLVYMDYALKNDFFNGYAEENFANRQLRLSSFPFRTLDLKDMTIEEYDFGYFNPSKYILNNTTFKRCIFENMTFSYASINSCCFQNCKFENPYYYESPDDSLYANVYDYYNFLFDDSLYERYDYSSLIKQLRDEHRMIRDTRWEHVDLSDSRYFQTLVFSESNFSEIKIELGYGSVILFDSCSFFGDSATIIGGDTGQSISVCFGNNDTNRIPDGVKVCSNVRILGADSINNKYNLVSIIGPDFEIRKKFIEELSDSFYLCDLVEFHIIYGGDESLEKAEKLLEVYKNRAIRSKSGRQIGISHMLKLLLDITRKGRPDSNTLELWLDWIEKNEYLDWDWSIWSETLEYRSLTYRKRFLMDIIVTSAEGYLTSEEVKEYVGIFE